MVGQDYSSSSAQARMQHGFQLLQQGRLDEAEAVFSAVLQADLRNVLAHHMLGLIFLQTGRLAEGVQSLETSIALDPGDPVAHSNLGHGLRVGGAFEDALEAYGKALALEPDFMDALANRALLLQALGRHAEALDDFDRAAALQPGDADVHYNRARTLADMGRLPEAASAFERAIALKPGYLEAEANLGNVLLDLGQGQEALACYDAAIALHGGQGPEERAQLLSNRGNALRALGRHAEALVACDQALAFDPDCAEAQLNAGLNRLTLGDFPGGWEAYEGRKRLIRTTGAPLDRPVWLGGTPLDGKTILLRSEQGLGDTLQFCRYADLLADRGATVVLEVEKPLTALLRTLRGASVVVEKGDTLPEADFQTLMMSLPFALRTSEQTIPAAVPYLHADPGQARAWAAGLAPQTRPRVGLVWSGGVRTDAFWGAGGRRDIPLAMLAALRDAPVEFHSLQKGEAAEAELRALQSQGWGGPAIADHAARLNDFSDTAALVANLDLVMAVDTSTAHLAGALGKPVWLLNRYDTCWRWLLDRDDSPWYPTMRLFRQAAPGDWGPVVQQIGHALSAWADGSTQPVGVQRPVC